MEALTADDPQRLGAYVLRRRLGEGGMGRVYLGLSPSGRAVAVKLVHHHLVPQKAFRDRFRQEVLAMRAVSGAFTAPVVGADPEADPPWLATVYIPGPDLAQVVAKTGPLPSESVWPLAAGLAEALEAVHTAGLLHRDVKPSNVLLPAEGPRLIDFGIARALDGTTLTTTGRVMGTPGFMAPEQAEGTGAGPASDVFALGAVIVYAATGTGPFGEGPPLAVLHRIVSSPPRLDGLPSPLRALAASCLEKAPGARPTPAEVLDRIRPWWSPPEQWPDTAPWPEAVTALLSHHAVPPRSGELPTKPVTIATANATANGTPNATANGTANEPGPPQELTRRHQQATRTATSGEPAAAARLMEQVAVDRARVLGPDHPDTLDSRHSHAYYLGNTGEYARAAELMEQIAADRARILGPDHRETLRARHNHAHYLGETGDHARAAELMEQVAADKARTLGPDDPATLRARHNHASNLGESGDYARAAELMEQLAADRVRILGPEHPDTLQARHEHAYDLGNAGDYARAVELMEQVAADRARILGPEHRETLRARHNHAHYLGKTGDHARAAELMEQVAADKARTLGPDHPETLRARHEHARLVGRQ